MKQNMRQKNMQAYLFLSPFLIFITVLYILPAILTVIMAFTSLDSAFIWKFNGINNFRKILMDPNTPIIAWNTVKYVGITIFLTVVLDLFFAIMTTYFIRDERKGNIFKSILMIPMITPGVVYSVLWLWLLEATPMVWPTRCIWLWAAVNRSTGLPSIRLIITIAGTLLHQHCLWHHSLFLGGEEHSRESVPAARVDGAGEWEIVRNIILPNLRFHITFIALWETLGLLTNYVTIMLITNGGSGCPDRGMGTECLPQGLLGQPVRLWRCHFAGADRGGYGADAGDRRCDAPSGKIPFLRNQEVRYEIFPETQV